MGNYSGALEDANEALKLAPQYIEVTQIFKSWHLDLKFKESFKESIITTSIVMIPLNAVLFAIVHVQIVDGFLLRNAIPVIVHKRLN